MKAFIKQLPPRSAVLVSVAFMALGLAGCASKLSASVTSFEKWPSSTAGATYRIQPEASQQNDLQYQTYADMIRAAIGRTGLVEAAEPAAARFVLSFQYGNPHTQSVVQEYADPFMYGGFAPGFYPWAGYYGGWGGGWGGAFAIAPPVVSTTVNSYKNQLSVTINDTDQGGAQVYQATAVHLSSTDNLPEIMPYLARAIFDGFPGNNGQVREVSYERVR